MTKQNPARHRPPLLPPGDGGRRRHRPPSGLGPRCPGGALRRHLHLDLAARHARGAGRLRLLDRQEDGLFRRSLDRHAARAVGRHRDGQVRRRGPGRHGLPSPGVFSFASRTAWTSSLVFHMGARDTFSLRLPQGRRLRTTSRGSRARRSCSAPPPGSRSPTRCSRAGRRHLDHHLRRGRLAHLGHRARRRAGRRRALLGRPARRVDRHRARVRILARRPALALPGQHLRRAPRRTSRTPTRWPSSSSTCAAGPWAWNSPSTTPPRRWRPCSSSSRRWPEPRAELGTMSILQQINVFRGDMENREGWGWHDMASWQQFFDLSAQIGQPPRSVPTSPPWMSTRSAPRCSTSRSDETPGPARRPAPTVSKGGQPP
jgi:hypothetical protein